MTFERKMTFFLSVAASLLVLLGIGAFYLFRAPAEEGMYYANADRTVKQIVLPDSSEVIYIQRLHCLIIFRIRKKEEWPH